MTMAYRAKNIDNGVIQVRWRCRSCARYPRRISGVASTFSDVDASGPFTKRMAVTTAIMDERIRNMSMRN
jgi:hypothetical protein